MKSYEEQTTIAAPLQKVYDYVSDFNRHGEWAGHGLQVTKDEPGPTTVGSTFSTVAKQFGTQREHSTVKEMTPPSRFVWESKGALGRITHWFALSEDGGSTTLTKGGELTEPSLVAKLSGWKIAKDMPAGFRADLAKIKAKLESQSG